jgi:hypothetical protein
LSPSLFGKTVEVTVTTELETKPRAARFTAFVKNDGVVITGAGKISGVSGPLDEIQADDALIVIDLPLEVRCIEGGMGDPGNSNHQNSSFGQLFRERSFDPVL